MNKVQPFKVGDKVECIDSPYSHLIEGQVYTISHIEDKIGYSKSWINLAEFDNTQIWNRFMQNRFVLHEYASLNIEDWL